MFMLQCLQSYLPQVVKQQACCSQSRCCRQLSIVVLLAFYQQFLCFQLVALQDFSDYISLCLTVNIVNVTCADAEGSRSWKGEMCGGTASGSLCCQVVVSSAGIHTFTRSDDATPSWLQRHISGTDRGELLGSESLDVSVC